MSSPQTERGGCFEPGAMRMEGGDRVQLPLHLQLLFKNEGCRRADCCSTDCRWFKNQQYRTDFTGKKDDGDDGECLVWLLSMRRCCTEWLHLLERSSIIPKWKNHLSRSTLTFFFFFLTHFNPLPVHEGSHEFSFTLGHTAAESSPTFWLTRHSKFLLT